MDQFQMYTADGKAVITLQIPTMTPPPEVISWGARHFVWKAEKKRYEEGMCFAASNLNVISK